ncbi:hypothetical protein RJ639_011728, partial [Escallonia herrerae]
MEKLRLNLCFVSKASTTVFPVPKLTEHAAGNQLTSSRSRAKLTIDPRNLSKISWYFPPSYITLSSDFMRMIVSKENSPQVKSWKTKNELKEKDSGGEEEKEDRTRAERPEKIPTDDEEGRLQRLHLLAAWIELQEAFLSALVSDNGDVMEDEIRGPLETVGSTFTFNTAWISRKVLTMTGSEKMPEDNERWCWKFSIIHGSFKIDRTLRELGSGLSDILGDEGVANTSDGDGSSNDGGGDLSEGDQSESEEFAQGVEESDSSEDEVAPRNTIGDVPFEWYKDEEHIGYNISGKKLKKKERQDKLDSFLASADDPNGWRKVMDEPNDE